jgi:integrase
VPAKKKANGEGPIYQRKDGRWVGVVTPPVGKRKNYYGKTRSEVQKKVTSALHGLHQGKMPVPERETTSQFLERWLRDVVKPGVRPRTHESYDLNVRRLTPYIGKTRLTRLTPAMIQGAYQTLLGDKLSKRSVRQAHTVLHTALRYAARSGALYYNSADAVTPPRAEQGEMQKLDPTQVRLLLDSTADDPWYALWSVLATLGLCLGVLLQPSGRYTGLPPRSRKGAGHAVHPVREQGYTPGRAHAPRRAAVVLQPLPAPVHRPLG